MDGFEPKFKRGYILLSRDLIDSSLWHLPPMHLRVALYLLMKARSKKNPIVLPDGLKINRGELVCGYSLIAENCSFYENRAVRECGKKKIGNILNDLCKIGFIKKNSHAKGTHISICNYDSYQSPDLYKSHTKETEVKRCGNAEETQVKRKRNASETLRNTNNNDNNENNEKKPSSSKSEICNVSKTPVRKTPPPPQEAIDVSNHLAKSILRRDPKNYMLRDAVYEKTVKRWAIDIDKLNRINGRSWSEINRTVQFVIDDDFWNKNILSGKTLRNKFDALALKAKSKEDYRPAVGSAEEAMAAQRKTLKELGII